MKNGGDGMATTRSRGSSAQGSRTLYQPRPGLRVVRPAAERPALKSSPTVPGTSQQRTPALPAVRSWPVARTSPNINQCSLACHAAPRLQARTTGQGVRADASQLSDASMAGCAQGPTRSGLEGMCGEARQRRRESDRRHHVGSLVSRSRFSVTGICRRRSATGAAP